MDYTLRFSNRRTLALQIQKDGSLLVLAPFFTRRDRIECFVEEKSLWIEKAREQMQKRRKYPEVPEEIQRLVVKAKELLPQRVAFYSEKMGLKPEKITITKAKTRFGSCSSKKTISFSCFLLLYPPEAVDYVVVHELAHLKYMNHQKEFYRLIEQLMPDYKKHRALLKE